MAVPVLSAGAGHWDNPPVPVSNPREGRQNPPRPKSSLKALPFIPLNTVDFEG